MGELPKSNAVADEHDSSDDTGSDRESHETSNLLTNADLSQNEKPLSIIIIYNNKNGNNMSATFATLETRRNWAELTQLLGWLPETVENWLIADRRVPSSLIMIRKFIKNYMRQLVRQVTCGVITLGTRGFHACSRMLHPTHLWVKLQEKPLVRSNVI